MPTYSLLSGNQHAVPYVQKSAAAAAIGATYTLITSIFSNPPVQIIIVSTLDQAVQISLNGVDDFIPVVAGATIVLDIKANNIVVPGNFGVYVKEIGNPTTGSIYVGGLSS